MRTEKGGEVHCFCRLGEAGEIAPCLSFPSCRSFLRRLLASEGAKEKGYVAAVISHLSNSGWTWDFVL